MRRTPLFWSKFVQPKLEKDCKRNAEHLLTRGERTMRGVR